MSNISTMIAAAMEERGRRPRVTDMITSNITDVRQGR
jgi:hypothetical protein